MQIEMINANGSVWVVKRRFPADSWFTQAINQFGGEEVCKAYCVEKVLFRAVSGLLSNKKRSRN